MKKFPVLGQFKGEYVPFDLVLEHENQCFINHGQSAQRLFERQGCCYTELFYIITDKRNNAEPTEKTERLARTYVLEKSYEWLMKHNQL